MLSIPLIPEALCPMLTGQQLVTIQEQDRIQEAIDHLSAAKTAELQGLDLIRSAKQILNIAPAL